MKRKLNWVDLVIIGLVIALFVGVGMFAKRYIGVRTPKIPVEVTFRVEGILIESVRGIRVGSTYSDKDTNRIIGEVTEVIVEDAYTLVKTGDGRVIKSKMPNRYTVYIKVLGLAEITDDFIRMGNRDIRIEGTIHIKNDITSLQTTVTSIKVLDNGGSDGNDR